VNRRFMYFIALLGLLHAYIGWRVVPDLGESVRVLGAVVLLASYALMLLAVLARGRMPRSQAARLAGPGLFMAGFFSSLLVLTLLRDLVLLAGILALSPAHVYTLRSVTAAAVAVLAVIATGVGFAAARRRARIVNVDVPILNLPAALHGFSIAQISDVHVGSSIRKQYVDAIVDAVNGLRPDLIAVTGDMVDGSVGELESHTAPLARLSSRHGTFLVTGNHEYYAGAGPWIAEFRRLGLKVLLNEHAVLTHDGSSPVVPRASGCSWPHRRPGSRRNPAGSLGGAPADGGPTRMLAQQRR